MDTIVCDIAKTRMQRDFNEALRVSGLIVSSIKFEDKIGLSVIIEILIDKDDCSCAKRYKNPETVCVSGFLRKDPFGV